MQSTLYRPIIVPYNEAEDGLIDLDSARSRYYRAATAGPGGRVADLWKGKASWFDIHHDLKVRCVLPSE